ncbi:MAG: hypothetical protein KAW12_15255 [Candidatus Aminicenantes bacterium]|nr:hypothetical protein [Candidatus Aminicenantes bacterium]
MKKSDRFYNVALLVLALAIVFVVVYKFVLNRPAGIEKPRIENPQEIAVATLDGGNIKLSDLIEKEKECYFLFFELTNCQSCIYKGVVELETLEKNGKKCFGAAIHDWPDEIKGWSHNYTLKTFVVIKKVAYYEHMHAPYLPVLIKFIDGEVHSYKYITP